MSTSSSRSFLSGEPDPGTDVKKILEEPSSLGMGRSSNGASLKNESSPLIQVLNDDQPAPATKILDTKEHDSDDDEPPPLLARQEQSQEGAEESPSLMELMLAAASAEETKDKEKTATRKKTKEISRDMGMKKGFLLSSGSKKKKKSVTKNLDNGSDVVSVTVSPPMKDTRVLPEVQETMKSRNPLADGSWATPDLTESIASNPRLSRALQDPKFVGALHTLERNPSKAKAIFQEDPDTAILVQEFGSILGLHFTKMGDAQQGSDVVPTPTKKSVSVVEEIPSDEGADNINAKGRRKDPEQEQVDKILADRELSDILMDPEMQRVMQECGLPGRMQTYMRHPDYGPNLRKLIEAGLLKIA